MSSYTEGQTHQLMDRFEAEGFTPAHITKLGQFGNLAGIKSILDGMAKIEPVGEDATRTITINDTTVAVNLGSTPKLPFDGARIEQHIGEGWSIIEKRKDGLYVDGHKVILHLSKRQKNGKWLKGHELRKELTGKPVLDANILDALLANPHLVPEDWKKDENGNTCYIFFWGTIYHRDSRGSLCVRYLYFDDGGWYSYYYWLACGWGGRSPTALRAS